MPEPKEHITIPTTIDGLEEAIDRVLAGEDRLLEDFREKLLHARIRHEYKVMKKNRGHGQAEKIRVELAAKYFNNPDRERFIQTILYEKY